MNWGYKIFLVIIVFVVGMLSMVYIAMQQTNEMFDENYYVQEMKYQSLIDAKKALNAIQTEPIIQQDQQFVTIQLPATSFENIEEGSVNFLKQDNKIHDLKYKLTPDSTGRFLVQKSEFKRGMYKIRVEWNNQKSHYYSDENIYIR
ncbi:MAG TPA: FixH family protein [Chitinophagales bacterium]|nr:FixH family protein [Chitinophagales bacterium]